MEKEINNDTVNNTVNDTVKDTDNNTVKETNKVLKYWCYLMRMFFRQNWRNRFLELFYPSRCLCCDKLLDLSKLDQNEKVKSFEMKFCTSCLNLLRPINRYCPSCSGTRYFLSPKQKTCPSCKKWDCSFERVIAIGEYQKFCRHAFYRIKYDNTCRIAYYWTKLLLTLRGAELQSLNADLLVSVPMHSWRRLQCNINPPDVIGKVLSSYLQLPFVEHLVCRKRDTRPQHLVTAEERYHNVTDAFYVNTKRNIFTGNKKFDIQGKRVILVDDVLTTGSTCNEITKALLKAGAASVVVVVLVRGQGLPSRKSKKVKSKKALFQ